MKLEKKHLEYYDWFDIQKALEEKLGVKDIRDCAGKYNNRENLVDEDFPYQDFWHFWLEHFDIHNGSYNYTCLAEVFDEMIETGKDYNGPVEDWIITILKALKEIMGDEWDKDIYIHHCW